MIICNHDGSGDSLSDEPIFVIFERENNPIDRIYYSVEIQ